MKMSIKSDLKKLSKKLSGIEKQIPFAASLAINDIAQSVVKAEKSGMKRDLNKPKPFTVNSIRFRRSNKKNLTAIVYIMERAEVYLGPTISGGTTKYPNKYPRFTPDEGAVKLNKYGNVPRKRHTDIRRVGMAGKGNSKFVVIDDQVYQRIGRGGQKLKHLGLLSNQWTYLRQFKFFTHARRAANKRSPIAINKAIKRAISTAR